jgi:hypothetical protein
MKLDPGADCAGRLCEVDDPCGHVQVDLLHGVPLACVHVVWDTTCGEWAFTEDVDACGPRRLLKRNDLLFDLIRGCDLTRISEIGWHSWHRGEVSFEDFKAGFGALGQHKAEYVTKQFFVKFTRPVRASTLRPDCFAMRVMFVEGEGGWWWARRVPIIRVDTNMVMPEKGDPVDCVRSATLVVDGPWADDAVDGSKHLFQGGPAIVEVEVRGDFILDCNGQAIDAEAIGLSTDRTGNGAPGGTFTSSFRVKQALPTPQGTYDAGQRPKGAQS